MVLHKDLCSSEGNLDPEFAELRVELFGFTVCIPKGDVIVVDMLEPLEESPGKVEMW